MEKKKKRKKLSFLKKVKEFEIKKTIFLSAIGLLTTLFVSWTVVGLFWGPEMIEAIAAASEQNDEEEQIDIVIAGSTTCLPIIEQASDKFADIYENYGFEVSGGGSGHGITSVGEGTIDIGMASRDITSEEEGLYDLEGVSFALDGIAVIVDTNSYAPSDRDLTLEEVKDMFEGDITNWDEVGGDDEDIVLIGRDSNSGTRKAFAEILDIDEFDDDMEELNSNGAVHDAVESNRHAIGYVGLGYVDDDVDACKIDGEEPSEETVKDESYPISRSLNVYVRDEDFKDKDGDIMLFVYWLLSSEAQEIVEDEGFIPLYEV